MKKVINVTEVDNEGLDAFLGQKITVYCFGFIYTGILEGVNDRQFSFKNKKPTSRWAAFLGSVS